MAMQPTKEEQAQVKLAQLIGAAMAELTTPAYLQRMQFLARDRRTKYLAHIEAGFTEAQALELCRV